MSLRFLKYFCFNSIALVPFIPSCSLLAGEIPQKDWTFDEIKEMIPKYKKNIENVSSKNIKQISINWNYKKPKTKAGIKKFITENINVLLKIKDNNEFNNKFINFVKKYLNISLTATRPHQGWDLGGSYNHVHEETTNDIFSEHRFLTSFQFFVIKNNDDEFITFKDNKLSFNFMISSRIIDNDENEPLYFYKGSIEMGVE
ncbi:hypothetical protein [Mycoplasma elephantis]|uniref:hypothetical protein n=1 Tax=Mycoplasma elephantis TaxID=114882 RepID=UPI0004833A8E|nr:hypothetical protein [Mycoplasma elephantis]